MFFWTYFCKFFPLKYFPKTSPPISVEIQIIIRKKIKSLFLAYASIANKMLIIDKY